MTRKRMIIEMSLIAFLVLMVLGPSRLAYARGGGGHGGGHASHGGHHGGGHEGHHGEHHEGHHGEHHEGHHGEHHEGHHGDHHDWHHHGGNYYHHGRKYYNLPEGHTYFSHGGVDYYYWDGAYYTKRAKEYVVVEPPIGAVIPALPEACEPLTIEGKTYYSCNDVTYLATPQGYQIVEEPESKGENTSQ